MAGLTVLDASITLAFLDAQDVHHSEATEIIGGEYDFAVSTVTLAETLVRAVATGSITDVLADLHRLQITEVGFGDFAAPTLAQLRHAYGLKMPDCCVILAGLNTQATGIATRDSHLRRVAAELGFETP